MFIKSNQNVGIGTTSPGYKLDVFQSTNDTTIRTRTAGAGAWFECRDETNYYAGVRHVGNNGARYWLTGMSQAVENYCIAMSNDGSTNRFLTINTSGNVGIGTTNPTAKLHIYDTSNQSSDATLYVESPSNNDFGIICAKLGYDYGILARVSSSAAYGISVYDGSSYTCRITGSGNIIIAGTLTESSSATLKENITPINNSLDLITKLVGVTYDRKDGSAKHRAGLIAEEVEQVLPNVVQKDQDGNASGIQYTNLIAYLVESIKELKAEIDLLKGK